VISGLLPPLCVNVGEEGNRIISFQEGFRKSKVNKLATKLLKDLVGKSAQLVLAVWGQLLHGQ